MPRRRTPACYLVPVLGVILWLGLASSAGAATAGKPVRVGGTLGLTGPVAAAAIVHKLTGEICVERWARAVSTPICSWKR